jgi:hypothetical protein
LNRACKALAAAAAVLLFPAASHAETVAADPAQAFAATIAASRHVLTVTDGHAGGPAADYLGEMAANSQFFLVGEEHGVAAIADTVRALVPMLSKAGYRHFAVETDPYMARLVEDLLREGGTAALANYLHEDGKSISMPFFNWEAEALLAQAFLAATPKDPQGNLWGLDQVFIGAYGPLLERIAGRAHDPAARELATALASQAKGNLEFLGQVDVAQFERLRGLLERSGDAAPLSLMDDMILSRRIYAPFIGQPGWSAYQANRQREDLMKRNFLAHYRAASEARVLFKFGSNHMARGLSATHVPSLGNFVADLALSQGKTAFNVLVLCGPGTEAIDFLGKAATCELDLAKKVPEVVDALDATHPTLFDLSTWKDHPKQWSHLPQDMRELLWAYDALLVVPKGRPAALL